MKDKFMIIMGAAAGIGIYMGINKLSQNKNAIKSKLNNMIDDASDLMNK